jgi:septal ring factor EnvC (AmiA/AmiB activator)
MVKSASARHLTGTEELLSAMSNEEVRPESKKSNGTLWQYILMVCCCILVVAAAGKGFLYLDNEISTVQSAVGSAVKDFNTLKAQVTAADTREQIAAANAEIEDLRMTNAQLRAEVKEIRDALETLKARKNSASPAQRKRR